MTAEKTYCIVRHYRDPDCESRRLPGRAYHGLSLEQAEAHCEWERKHPCVLSLDSQGKPRWTETFEEESG